MTNKYCRNGPGPIRTRGLGRGRDRGVRGVRGRGGRRGGAGDTPSAKSLADLDMELEAFMGEGKGLEKANADTPAVSKNAPVREDVTMV
jgi:C-terminal duplication domain of Friend of PRMT1